MARAVPGREARGGFRRGSPARTQGEAARHAPGREGPERATGRSRPRPGRGSDGGASAPSGHRHPLRRPEHEAIDAIALTSALPFTTHPSRPVALEGESYADERSIPMGHVATISARFFETLGIVPLEGRAFDERDRPGGEPTALVNASFARQRFRDSSPVGRRLRVGSVEGPPAWRTVVGVVPDVWMDGPRDERPAGVCMPLEQGDETALRVVLRGQRAPEFLADPLRTQIGSASAPLRVFDRPRAGLGVERGAGAVVGRRGPPRPRDLRGGPGRDVRDGVSRHPPAGPGRLGREPGRGVEE